MSHHKPEISVTELAALLGTATSHICVLDIREHSEWQQSHITHPAVRHLPMSTLEHHLEELPQNQPIAVLCRSGGRSARITAFLEALGYQAANVTGGMQAWVAEVDPSLPTP